MRKYISFTIMSLLCFQLYAQEIKSKSELSSANSVLDSYLKSEFGKEQPEPSEYKEARKLYYYDIDNDGDQDLIAFFTLEGIGGGNNWQYYIAIFINENNKFKFIDYLILYGDSSKKYRDGKLIGFKNGYINFKLYGFDYETNKKIITTIGITVKGNKIITTKPI